jgi:hypothetical protein
MRIQYLGDDLLVCFSRGERRDLIGREGRRSRKVGAPDRSRHW